MFENLSDRLQGIFSGLKSKGRLTEDDINAAMREIRMALLEADVNFKVVKSFMRECEGALPDRRGARFAHAGAERHQDRARRADRRYWAATDSELELSQPHSRRHHARGLAGLGQNYRRRQACVSAEGQKATARLLVACDVYRPAAADQLQTLGDEMGVKVYRGDGARPGENRERRACVSPSTTCATW